MEKSYCTDSYAQNIFFIVQEDAHGGRRGGIPMYSIFLFAIMPSVSTASHVIKQKQHFSDHSNPI